MHTKKILSWLTSFAILGAYTGFLLLSDGYREDGRAYARDVMMVESLRPGMTMGPVALAAVGRDGQSTVSLPAGIFRLLKPWIAKQCTVVNAHTVRCRGFPWLVFIPAFPHVS